MTVTAAISATSVTTATTHVELSAICRTEPAGVTPTSNKHPTSTQQGKKARRKKQMREHLVIFLLRWFLRSDTVRAA